MKDLIRGILRKSSISLVVRGADGEHGLQIFQKNKPPYIAGMLSAYASQSTSLYAQTNEAVKK
jgi:hypothetical protein